jgi:hypothetical protein
LTIIFLANLRSIKAVIEKLYYHAAQNTVKNKFTLGSGRGGKRDFAAVVFGPHLRATFSWGSRSHAEKLA